MSWLTNIFKPEPEACPVCSNEMPTEPAPLAYVDTSTISKPADQQHFVKTENYAETCGKCGDFEGQNLPNILTGDIGEF